MRFAVTSSNTTSPNAKTSTCAAAAASTPSALSRLQCRDRSGHGVPGTIEIHGEEQKVVRKSPEPPGKQRCVCWLKEQPPVPTPLLLNVNMPAVAICILMHVAGTELDSATRYEHTEQQTCSCPLIHVR